MIAKTYRILQYGWQFIADSLATAAPTHSVGHVSMEVLEDRVLYDASPLASLLTTGEPVDLNGSIDQQIVDLLANVDEALAGSPLTDYGLNYDLKNVQFDAPDSLYSLDNLLMYDVRDFNDVRTASEIASSYQSTLPHNESDLVANWRFNDLSAAGVVTEAVSGNNFNVVHLTGTGFLASDPSLTLRVTENALDGPVVGSVSGIDIDREARITQLLATDPIDTALDAIDSNAGSNATATDLSDFDDVNEPESDYSDTVQNSLDSTLETSSLRHDVVFVQDGLYDHDTLLSELFGADSDGRTLDVIVLDRLEDGFDQIDRYLAQYQDLDAIHIASNGADGFIQFGSSWLTDENVDQHLESLQRWGIALSADGDILIYGCDVALGPNGTSLVGLTASTTGADVAVSIDGNWGLAYTHGEIETFALISLSETYADDTSNGNLHFAPSEIAFIDSGVVDFETIIANLDANVEVIILDSEQDGLSQITQALAGRSDIDALHIFSHGVDGGIQVGATWINDFSLQWQSDIIGSWSSALSADADLLLYGCNIASTADGQEFLSELASITGADVAASSDETGHASLGGDWDLEFSTGTIESEMAVDADDMEAWDELLAITANGTATSAQTASGTGLTFSHTVASGSDRALYVTLAIDGVGAGVNSVTYGGVNLTQVGRTAGNHAVEIWRLVNPTVGTANVVVSLGTTSALKAGAVTYNGVDQGTPNGTYASATGTGTTATLNVSSATDNLVLDVTNWDNNPTGYSIGANQSSVWSLTNTAHRGVTTAEAGAATVTMSSTVSASNQWEMGALSINAAESPLANVVPGSQTTAEDTSLIFSSGNGNQISISDTPGASLDVTLSITNGTLTLSGTTGLTFSTGDGTSDTTMTISGTVEDINTALNGLTFDPTANYAGGATLTIETSEATSALDVDAALDGRYTFDNTGALGTDDSGNGNTGTVVGATAFNDPTRGDVLNFDGNDYVQIAGHFGNPANLTLAAWVNLTTADSGGSDVISLGDSAMLRVDNAGKLEGIFYDGSTWTVTSYNVTLAGAGWHHVAYSFNDAGNAAKLYLDGVEVASTSTFSSINYSLGANSFIGKHGNGGSTWDFTGKIDDARIYTRALSGAEVAELAAGGTPATDTDNIAITVIPDTDLRTTATTDGGFSINSDGGNDTYLEADDGGAVFGSLTQLSLEARVSLAGTPEFPHLIDYAAGSSSNEFNLLMSGASTVRVNIGSVGYNFAGDYSEIRDGQVHTVGLTWTNSGTARFYIDGQFREELTGVRTGYTIAGGGNLMLGQDQDSLGADFAANQHAQATYYDVRLFDDVRTDSEMAASYRSDLPYNEAGMIANWQFDQLSSDGVVTDTVSGNNLTVQNVAGAGFVHNETSLTFALDENAVAGTIVGSVYGVDPERETQTASLLAADSNLRYSAETGKFYKLINVSAAWTTAQSSANSNMLGGVSGQLLTIASAAENELATLFANQVGGDVWLGYSDQIVEGEFQEYTGNTAGKVIWRGTASGYRVDDAYSNWAAGEPNDDGGQDFARLYVNGEWDDDGGGTLLRSIVEWNADAVLDATDALTYAIQSQTVAGAFAIDASTGTIIVADGTLLDYETNATHSMTVRVTDGDSNFYDEVFTVSLSDLAESNNAPTDLSSGIELNTDGGNDSYLYLTDGRPVLGGLTQLTLEASFQIDSVPTGSIPIIDYQEGGIATEFGVAINPNGSLQIVIADGAPQLTTMNYSQLLDGNQHHLAVSWDNTNGDVHFYIDGEFAESITGVRTGHALYNATITQLVIGQDPDDAGDLYSDKVFSGTIYDVRIWSEIRSEAEISLNYQNKFDGGSLPTGLIANWQMDGFNGSNEVVDVVSGNNLSIGHATGTGFIASTPVEDLHISENATNGSTVGYVIPSDPDVSNDVVNDGLFQEASPPSGGSTSYAASTSFGDWTVGDTTGVVLFNGDNAETPPSGGHVVSLNNAYASISQTLTTEIGKQYQIVFDHAGGFGDAVVDHVTTRVSADGQSQNFTLEKPSGWNFYSNLGWETRSMTFTASDISTELVFQTTNETLKDSGMIAGVRVIEIPAAVTTILNNDPTLSYDAATGKFYRYVNSPDGFDVSLAAATASSLNGVSGQLVTIDSAYENELIRQFAVDSGSDIWLGARDTNNDGNWNWLDGGTESNEQFWTGGSAGSAAAGFYAPTFGQSESAGEDYARMNTDGTWADDTAGSNNTLVIEWDASEVLTNFTFSLTDDAGGRFAIDSSTGEITVADGSLLDYETVTSHSIDVQTTDAAGNTYTETMTIAVDDVGGDALLTVPIAQTTDEDTALTFSSGGGNAIVIDSGSSDDPIVAVSLTVANGTLTLASTTGITFLDGTSDGDATLTISGTESAINTALDGLQYQGTQDYNGSDTLTVTTGSDAAVEANLHARYEFLNGSLEDKTANNHDGTASGDPTLTRDTERGDVMTFDGDDRINIPGGTSGLGDTVTIAAWVNLDAGQQDDVFLSIGDDFYVTLDESNVSRSMSIFANGYTTGSLSATNNIAGEGWNHVAATLDNVNKIVVLYLNGEEIRRGTFSFSDINWGVTGSPDISIGARTDGSNAFHGSLDDVRVYDRVLTETEITAVLGDQGYATENVAITIDPVNDAPVLDNAGFLTLDTITEDDFSNSGNTVAEIIASDGGGDRITDPDSGALEGIAIFTTSATHGTWQYNTGSGWTDIGTVSVSESLLLRATDSLRFVPNGENGETASIAFAAWDQTTGAAGTKVDTSSFGGTTAFSDATDSAVITVTNVNDAPVLDNSGNTTLTTITEDQTTNGGQTVASIISSAGGDRITDVDSGAVEGIAITATTNGNGSWEYSTNGGSTWSSVGTISGTSSLLLRSTDLVRFVPNAQNATTGDITFRAWDQTSGTFGTKVDTSTNGTTTAFSTATEVASITVTAVNDDPVVSHGGAYSINEGDTLFLDASGTTDVDSGSLTYRWDLNNDGQYTNLVTSSATMGVTWGTLSGLGLGDDGTYTIGLQVDDGDGGVVTNSTTVTIVNTAPVLTATGAATTGGNATYTLTLTDVDPGNDTVSQWIVNWGDGSIVTYAGDPSSVTHVYSNDLAGLTFNINVSAIDEDGQYYEARLLAPAYVGDHVAEFDGFGGVSLGTFAPSGDGIGGHGNIVIMPSGNYLVSGVDTGNILEYQPDGTLVGDFVAASDPNLNNPGGMAYGPDGNLYVADFGGGKVVRFNGATGAYIDNFVASGLSNPLGLEFGPDGNLYVANRGSAGVLRYDGTTGVLDSGFIVASISGAEDLTFGPDGNLYVGSSSGVIRVNATTGATSTFIANGSGGLLLAAGVEFGPDGHLYVADQNADVIRRYDGTTGAYIDNYATGVDGPAYLEFTADHRVTVTNSNQSPTIATNTGDTVLEGSLGNVVTTAMLNEGDPDDDGAELTYTVTTDVANGTLKLNGVAIGLNDTFTQADVDAGLISYDHNGSETTADSFQFSLADGGENSSTPATGSFSFTVTPVNDAPVLDNAGDLRLPTITEDDVNNAGLTVAQILASDSGNPITDPDAGAVEGIAITTRNNGRGLWEYSIDGGSNWSVVGTVSESEALLLRATDLVRFAPDGQNGNVTDRTFEFRAWDQTSGTAGTKVDTTTNGGSTAFSTDIETVAITTTDVNDAPVLDNSGTVTLTAQTEDAGAPVGAVGTVITSLVQIGGNVTDVDASPQTGVAITAADATNGTWWYTTDSGASWNALGSVSESSARVLNANSNTRIYFQSNADFNGTISDAVTFRAWDRSLGANGSLQDASTGGGTTAFSANSETADLTINAINDDPTNAGSLPTDLAVTEDVASNVDLSAIDLSDIDHGGGSLTIKLTTSTGGNLTAAAGTGITLGGSGSGALTLTGTQADLNAYLNTASNVTYLHSTAHLFGNDADTINVKVNDNGNTGTGGGSDIDFGTVNVDITAVNDSPLVGANTGTTVAEGGTVTITTAMLGEADVDDSGTGLTYTITSGPTNGQLELTTNVGVAITSFTQDDIDNSRVVFVHDGTQATTDSFDFSLADGGEDGSTPATGTFNFTVTNVNDAPTDIAPNSFTIDENIDTSSGVSVGTLTSTDEDTGETFTYSVVGGTDQTKFTISGDQLVLTDGVLNFENQSSYSVIIRSTDSGGLWYEETLTVNVNDLNETPTDIAPNSFNIDENIDTTAGVSVGTLTSADVDSGETFTYTVVGGTDQAKFTISGDQLVLTDGVLNFENQSSYSVTVRSTDSGGLWYEETLTVNVNDLNETPTDIAPNSFNIDENTDTTAGLSVGTLTSADVDSGETFTYTVVGGTDQAKFTISGDQLVLTDGVLNFENQSSYSVTIRSTDSGGLWYEEMLTVNVNDLNETPTDIAPNSFNIDENTDTTAGVSVGTLTSTDVDSGDTFTYTVVGGADQAKFSISGDQLMITDGVLSFENQSSYSVTIRTTDSGSLWYEETLTVNVNDLNETPTDIAPNSFNINENIDTTAGMSVGTLTSIDQDAGDTFTYTVVGGADQAKFTISGNQLVLTDGVLDFETKPSYNVTVRTTDSGGLWYEETLTVNVNDLNETPTDIAPNSFNINENTDTTAGVSVGTLTSTDVDSGETFTYTVVGGVDQAKFTISGDQLVITDGVLNFENQSSYSVTVRSTDSGGLWYEETLTINVNDLNETPTDIAPNSFNINENTDTTAGVSVGTLTSADVDSGDTFTYTVVGGADQTKFTISGDQLVITDGVLNFENQPSYSVTIRTTDSGGLWYEETLTINVNDLNETPTDIAPNSFNINENTDTTAGVSVGTLTSTDVDSGDTFTYTVVVGGADHAKFSISGDQLVITDGVLNYENQSSYSVTVRSTDSGGLWYEETLTINVNDLNETPTDIAPNSFSINENVDTTAGVSVGTLTSTDVDIGDTFTYTVVGGADQAKFTISGDQLLITDGVLNFENQPSYSVTIRTTDSGGLWYEETITINVNDLNETPTDIAPNSFSINENVDTTAGVSVGTLTSTDVDSGDTFTYTVVGGADQAKFTISGDQLVITDGVLNFENQPSYSVTIRTTDNGGLWYEETLTINVNDLNEMPTDIAPNSFFINENTDTTAGVSVGTLTSTDVDSGDTFTYTVVGGTDQAKFSISGDQLLIADGVLNFENQPSYSVTIRTTDSGGLWYEETLTINVNDLNETPTDIAPNSFNINENTDTTAGVSVGTLTTTDVDSGDTFTYTVVGGADQAKFTISGDQLVITDGVLNFENQPNYSVTIRTTDSGGLWYEETLTVNVNDLNETPTDIAPNSFSINENMDTTAGVSVGTLTTTDVDSGDTFTYTVVGGTDQAKFSISGDQLVITDGVLNFENQSSYSVTVRSTDSGGLWYEETLTINVNDLNETPTDIAPNSFNINENTDTTAGVSVGTLTSADVDSGETFTYTVVGGADQAKFSISGDQLVITDGVLNFENQSSYSVTIRSTDSGGLWYEETLTINVNDLNETPTDISPNSFNINENTDTTAGVSVGTLTSTDVDSGDTFTYTVVGGADQAKFTISGDQLVITDGVLDFENQPSYSVTIRTTDSGGLWYEETLTINVNDLNETPTDIAPNSFNINENTDTTAGVSVGTLTTTDPDSGDTFTYSVVGGTDQAKFSISGDQLVLTDGILDNEVQASYSVTVRVTDSGGLTYDETVTVNVIDLNEAPTDIAPNSFSVNENVDTTAGYNVGTLTTTDPDTGETFTYSIFGGADGAKFTISGDQLVLTDGMLNFENQSSYSVTVRVTDSGGLTYDETLTVNVNDLNETPTDIAPNSFSINENTDTTAGVSVGTLTSTDVDSGDSFTYSVVGGADQAKFSISGDQLVITDGVLNFEIQSSYSVTIRTTDSGGLWYEETLTVNVNDLNETPTDITPNSFSINENTDTTAGVSVGTLTSTDVDSGDAFTYTVVGGADQTKFTISGDQLVLTDGVLNYETKPNYSVTIRTTDSGGLWYEETLTINVNDLNETPTDITPNSFNINENVDTTGSYNVGTLTTTDPDTGDTYTYTVVGGTDQANFSISGDQLVLTDGVLNFETKPSYSVTIRTTDSGGLWYEETLTINVNDLNETPTDISPNSFNINENTDTTAGVSVGTLTSTDVDSGDMFTYTVVGGADQAKFSISGNQLVLTDGDLNYEAKPSYSVTVRTTDSGGLWYEETLTVNVNDLNEAPIVNDQIFSVNENSFNGTTVGFVLASDVDAGDTLSYTLLGGSGATAFAIDGATGRVYVADASQLDFETSPSFSLTIEVRDSAGLLDTATITIQLNDVNDEQVLVTNLPLTVTEGFSGVINSSLLLTTDEEQGPTNLVYTLTSLPAGGTVLLNGSASLTFTQDDLNSSRVIYQHGGGESSIDSFNFNVDDGLGLVSTGTFVINVNPVNDAPVAIDDNLLVLEGATYNGLATELLGNDFDAEGTPLSAVLVSGPSHGTLTLNSDGSFVYSHDGSETPSDSFQYRVSDGSLASNVATVNLTILAINDPPQGFSDHYSTNAGIFLNELVGVLANDTDIENNALIAVLIQQPAHGVVVLNANGSFQYMPHSGFFGTDTFQYVPHDGNLAGNLTTVTIEVIAVAPPVVVSSDPPERTPDAPPPSTVELESSLSQVRGSSQAATSLTAVSTLGSVVKVPPAQDFVAVKTLGLSQFETTEDIREYIRMIIDRNQAEVALQMMLNNVSREMLEESDEIRRMRLESPSVAFDAKYLFQQMEDTQDMFSNQLDTIRFSVGAVTTVGTLGYLWWSLRGGVLMAAAFAKLPTWQILDMLPVLDNYRASHGKHDELDDFFE